MSTAIVAAWSAPTNASRFDGAGSADAPVPDEYVLGHDAAASTTLVRPCIELRRALLHDVARDPFGISSGPAMSIDANECRNGSPAK